MAQAHRPLPPQALLLAYYDYDPGTGIVVYRCNGSPAAYNTAGRYVHLPFNRVVWAAHRLIWRMYTGEDPGELEIDHVDGDRANNRISNLRPATRTQNARNRVKPHTNWTGFLGVRFEPDRKKFRAQGKRNGRRVHIGYFLTAEEAAVAATAWRHQQYEEFSRGSPLKTPEPVASELFLKFKADPVGMVAQTEAKFRINF